MTATATQPKVKRTLAGDVNPHAGVSNPMAVASPMVTFKPRPAAPNFAQIRRSLDADIGGSVRRVLGHSIMSEFDNFIAVGQGRWVFDTDQQRVHRTGRCWVNREHGSTTDIALPVQRHFSAALAFALQVDEEDILPGIQPGQPVAKSLANKLAAAFPPAHNIFWLSRWNEARQLDLAGHGLGERLLARGIDLTAAPHLARQDSKTGALLLLARETCTGAPLAIWEFTAGCVEPVVTGTPGGGVAFAPLNSPTLANSRSAPVVTLTTSLATWARMLASDKTVHLGDPRSWLPPLGVSEVRLMTESQAETEAAVRAIRERHPWLRVSALPHLTSKQWKGAACD